MKKLIYLILVLFAFTLFAPSQVNAQADSSCQIFGTGNNLTIAQGTVKRFYTKYIPGATYGWSVIGGNAAIVGPRNLHYVDVQGIGCGSFTICVSYSIDGQAPCCKCETGEVTCGPPPPSCCIHYVNSTMQPPWVKVKFQVCGPGVVSAKLFSWNGSSYDLLWTDNHGSPYNPAYTYNLNFNNFSCWQIYCLKICGYLADGTECCTTRFAVRIDCDANGYFNGVTDIYYPGCTGGGGGGGGLPVDKSSQSNGKLALAPNPVSNILQVTLPEKNKITVLQFTDRNGIIVKSVPVNGKAVIRISVSDLIAGNYFIKPDDPLVESSVFIKQ